MVAPLDSGSTPRSPAVVAFQQKTAALQRALLGANAVANETMSRVQLLKRAVQETPSADAKLDAEVRRIETGLRDIQTALAGDPTMARRSEPTPPSLLNRVNGIANSLWSNTMEDATATQKRQYEIAAAELGGLLDRLRTLRRAGSQARGGSGGDGWGAVDERPSAGLETVMARCT